MGDPLIADNEGTPGGLGGGAATDVYTLAHQICTDPVNWETLIDTGLVGLDALGSYINPFGSLISAGVGWLLEHIPGLSDVWDKLMGDAAAIEQVASTWENISTSLNSTGQGIATASSQIESWTGQARESYGEVAKAWQASVEGASTEAESIAVVVRLIGGAVAALKDVVYTLISDFVEFTVIPAALSALATSWCTFGGSIAVAITYIEIQADVTATQITLKITKVTEEITVISERAAKVIAKLEKMKGSLKTLDETVAKVPKWVDRTIAGAHGQVEQTGEGVKHHQEAGASAE